MTSEVFTIDESNINVSLTVNGSSRGEVTVEDGTTVLQFVTNQAKAAGIRSFSVYLDGNKLDSADAQDEIQDGASIEIVAKDSRG